MTILPNCNRCGQCGCECGSLPYAMTVTFSGLQNKSHTPHCPLTITSNFGHGASGITMAPGGDSSGQLSEVLILEGGCGYAKLGHVEPTLSISGGSGTGATFTPTLEPVDPAVSESCRTWRLKSVAMSGGSGYLDGDSLTIAATNGATEVWPAAATLAIGRVQPTVSATAAGGTGATFGVTLAKSQDSNGRDIWAVSKVTMTGGTGYEAGDLLTFGIAEGDTEEAAASAEITAGKAPPTLTIPGNATGTVSTQPIGDGNYSVSAVTVTSGGSGYTNGAYLTFGKAANDVVVTNATARVMVKYIEPQNAIVDVVSASGSGAVLQPVWQLVSTPTWLRPNIKVYRLASVTVLNGGTGYADYDSIFISFPSGANGGVYYSAVIDTDIVGANGEIQQVYVEDGSQGNLYRGARTDVLESVELLGGGSYYKDLGGLAVKVTNGGAYYRTSPTPNAVTVASGGEYYRESKTAAPCVASVSIIATGCAGSSGYGWALLSPVIDTTAGSPTFGTITGATVTQNSPTPQRSWWWRETNQELLNDTPLVLVANSPKKLVTLTLNACYGSGACATVNAAGERIEPTLRLYAGRVSDAEGPVPCEVCGGSTVTATLSSHTDDQGRPYWSVASASASGGVNCFPTMRARVEQDSPCLSGIMPNITLTATDGVLTAATVNDPGKFWRELAYDGQPGPIRAVQLVSGGGGYARYGREPPSLVISGGNATFAPTLSKHADDCGLDYWRIDSVAVSGGSGYTAGQSLSIALATENDKEDEAAVLAVQVGEGGVPSGVTVTKKGRYYRENASLPPYVADVSVAVTQLPPSDGSGATFAVEVEDDTSSPSFGSVKSVKIVNGGSGYQILGAPYDCSYTKSLCIDDHRFEVGLQFRGRGKKPRLTISEESDPVAVFEADDPLEDCTSLPSSASLLYLAETGSATLSPGGEATRDCEPAGYCGSGPPGCRYVPDYQGLRLINNILFPSVGCGTMSWTAELTINNEGSPGNIQPGTYSFFRSVVPQAGLENLQWAFTLPRDPADGRFAVLPIVDNVIIVPGQQNDDQPCAGTFNWGPDANVYDRWAALDVSIVCIRGKWCVFPIFSNQGCGWPCGGFGQTPFWSWGPSEDELFANGVIPIEVANGGFRLKAGTHHFELGDPAGGTCSIRCAVDLTISY